MYIVLLFMDSLFIMSPHSKNFYGIRINVSLRRHEVVFNHSGCRRAFSNINRIRGAFVVRDPYKAMGSYSKGVDIGVRIYHFLSY